MESFMGTQLPEGYRPSEKESFMNPLQTEYFRQKLLKWRDELLQNSLDTFHHLQEGYASTPDFTDKAAIEEDLSAELRARDRERKLIVKIDEALKRIEEGSYGYCEETGEPISLRRLDARPVATLSLEAQERRERYERVYNA
jgi:DnaK suppressor protein